MVEGRRGMRVGGMGGMKGGEREKEEEGGRVEEGGKGMGVEDGKTFFQRVSFFVEGNGIQTDATTSSFNAEWVGGGEWREGGVGGGKVWSGGRVGWVGGRWGVGGG